MYAFPSGEDEDGGAGGVGEVGVGEDGALMPLDKKTTSSE
jgi:hypothetical protein